MRVLFVTHYFAPEVGAPQTRLAETVRLLSERGWDVAVVTNHPHYPDGRTRGGYSALSVRRDLIKGIPVLRLPVIARPNRGFVDRVIDQASFAFCACAAIDAARRADVMVVESPPLFLGATARWLQALARKPYVLHVADPWPDYPIELGALKHPMGIRMARALERLAYAGAARITTPTEGCAEMVRQQAVARDKVTVLPNSVDIDRFDPNASPELARSQLGWEERPTIGYVGTVGLAQGLSTLVDAAAILQTRVGPTGGPVIRVVGDGQDRDGLEARARSLGLENLQFHGSVPATDVARVFQACDATVTLLRKGRMAEAALPTKLVEALAAGRPIIVSADGEAADIVRHASAGIATAAEDSSGLAEAILQLSADPERRSRMGKHARDAAVTRFDRRIVVGRLAGILTDAVASEAARHAG